MKNPIPSLALLLATVAALSAAATLAKSPSDSATATMPMAYQQPPIQMALDADAQQAFVADIKSALVDSDTKLAAKLCVNLLPDTRHKPFARCGQKENASVFAYVATGGHITHTYASDASAFYRPISMGSVGKILGLYLLARSGAHTNEMWCVKSFAEMGNGDSFMGHPRCDTPAAFVSAARATATSNNLAFRWRIAQLDADWIRSELHAIGVTNVPSDVHPAAAVSTGVIELSPWLAMTMLSAVVDESQPHALAMTVEPNFSLKVKAQFETLRQRFTPQVRAYIKELLQAPIRHPNGTVRHLANALSPSAIAKSGTPTGGKNGHTTGKFLLYANQRPDGLWTTALVAVQSQKPSISLGTKLTGSDFATLHKLAIDAGNQPLSSALVSAIKARGKAAPSAIAAAPLTSSPSL